MSRLTVAASLLFAMLAGIESRDSAAIASAASPGPVAQAPPPNSCLGCHLQDNAASTALHLVEWRRSVHGRQNIGCDRCHGGNPAAPTAAGAHAGHMKSDDPLSPTNRANMSGTCGRCHAPELEAFESGAHFKMGQAGNILAPRCITCHGEMAAERVSPASVQAQCAQCHAAGQSAAHPEFISTIRLTIVQQQLVAALSEEIGTFVSGMPAGPARAQAAADLARANAARRAANATMHSGDPRASAPLLDAQDQIFLLARRLLLPPARLVDGGPWR